MDNEREELRRTRTWSARVEEENSPPPAGNDPAKETLRKQSAEFNARVHDALAEIPVPPDLREQILARSKTIVVPGWRPHHQALGLAAAFVILGALAMWWFRPAGEDVTFAGFRSRMVSFAVRQYAMDIHTNQLAAVQTHLARNGRPAEFELPPKLAERPVVGGANLTWQGKPVGMVCFRAITGHTLYLFVIDSAHAPHNTQTDVSTEKNLGTAAWISGGKTFLLAGEVPPEVLESLVKS